MFSLTSVAIAAWIASSPVTCVCCEGEDQGGRTTDASQTLDSCFSRRVSRETRRRGRANARRTGLKSSSESRANPRKPANERARTARQSSFRVRACVGSDAEGEGEARDDALAEALWEVSEALIDDALARREAAAAAVDGPGPGAAAGDGGWRNNIHAKVGGGARVPTSR